LIDQEHIYSFGWGRAPCDVLSPRRFGGFGCPVRLWE
jgi:hypothetical protein